ncbi:MAG: hypothetical protein IJ529_01610 [Alphaproteobacteria bacterium]|nr:hypothetical protein [Alphaproteobacteria bacterium]
MAQKKNFTNVMKNVVIMLMVVIGFTACDDQHDEWMVETKPAAVVNTNTEVMVKSVERDENNGTATIEKVVDGVAMDTTITVPLGGVSFHIDAKDTILVSDVDVVSNSFEQNGKTSTENYETDGVYYTKSAKKYLHTLNKYVKNIEISYLDAYTYVWGVRVDFPKANGACSYNNVSVVEDGANTQFNYNLATTNYTVSFMETGRSEAGYEELAMNADDKLIDTKKTNEGFEVVEFDANGNPSVSRSWIEVTRTYSITGAKKSVYEVMLNSSVQAPAYSIVTLPSFSLNKIDAAASAVRDGGTRTEGNFAIGQHVQDYTVGNDQFTKTFVLSYETAVWSDGKNTFTMPSANFQNLRDDNFTMTAMEGTYEYERELNTHKMGATFADKAVSAQAETEVRVTITRDELLDTRISDEGFDYVNPTTSNTWIEITETWSVSGEKKYKKSVNVNNGITAPAAIVKILTNFNLTQSDAVLGEETLTATRTVGEFTVGTYSRSFAVGNDKFTRVFSLTYEKATYNPMNHEMIWKGYENVSDNGFNTGNLSDKESEGVNYERKSYAHGMSATYNGRSASSNAAAELWVKKADEQPEERETPTWLGNPVSAKYTRVQKATGEKFMDMIVFIYQNGVVMAPNGKVDMNLTYAFDANVASQQGVERCSKTANYSGVWTGSKWAPAKITITSGRWIYAGLNAAWDHTVMENNAITLGIGVDVTPTPKAQSYKIEGNKITISYAVNNGKTTADTSLSLR